MQLKIASIAIIVIAVVGAAWYALSANRAIAPGGDRSPMATTTDTAVIPEEETDGGPAFTVITLTDAGFSPNSVSVAQGETVRFVNESSRGMWVGSDEHPTHTEYDGTSTREHCADGANTSGSFDMCAAVANGEHWDFTFERAGTFGFHNHVGAAHTGTVIVR